MSRIGLKPITVPSGVEVKQDGQTVRVKGKNGELVRDISPIITMHINGEEITFERPNETNASKSVHGTTRSLVANMIEGVSEGFSKELELVGVGYRAQKQGKKLVLTVGLSHPVEFEEEDGITIDVPSNTEIKISGPDKEAVGQLAAVIRAVRPPEPYKGKGIKYKGEYIIRKEGKTGK